MTPYQQITVVSIHLPIGETLEHIEDADEDEPGGGVQGHGGEEGLPGLGGQEEGGNQGGPGKHGLGHWHS